MRDEAYSLPRGWVRRSLRLLPAIIRWLVQLGQGPRTPVEETLGSAILSNGFEELNTLPSHLAWSEENGKKNCGDWPCWMVFSGVLCWMLAQGKRVRIGSEDPRLVK